MVATAPKSAPASSPSVAFTPTAEPTREAMAKALTRPALIDCDLHNELHGDVQALVPYLSKRWQQHIETFGARGPGGSFYPRFMDHRQDARPPSGKRAGSDVHFTRSHYLDPYNVAYAVLIPVFTLSGFVLQSVQAVSGFALAAATVALAMRLPRAAAQAALDGTPTRAGVTAVSV